MPFTYRDKPKLAERLRGKTGEEILKELTSDLDPERRMFFDSPSWRTRHNNRSGFSRGFPFEDDRKRADIRTYLDEIAARHPEFADQLKEPPWEEDFGDSFGRQRQGSNSAKEPHNEPSGSNQAPTAVKEPRQSLTNFGLRNTVPLGPGAIVEEERRQRSMSAPPDNRSADQPRRFVTKCEIPVMNDPKPDPAVPMPDLSGKGAPEQTQPKANNAPNVRVIPIQVEGRDTPIVNTNIDTTTNFGSETFRESPFEGRLPRDFGTYQRHSPRFAHKERDQVPPQFQYAPQYQQYVPPHQQQQFMPQQQFVPPQQQQQPQQQPKQAFAQQQHSQKPSAPPPQQQQFQPQPPPPQNSKPPQTDETDSKPPPKPEPIKDPIEKVQVIQKQVEDLMRQVESFNGKSRSDKQYLMLDELLTRQLLLLDNIDTEGKDNVRQARKDAIRSIQRCISTLENKVPLLENNESTASVSENQGALVKVEEVPQAMEVDQTKENTPVDTKESQKMEVDDKANKDLQQAPPQDQQQQQQPQAQQQEPQQPIQEENKEKV